MPRIPSDSSPIQRSASQSSSPTNSAGATNVIEDSQAIQDRFNRLELQHVSTGTLVHGSRAAVVTYTGVTALVLATGATVALSAGIGAGVAAGFCIIGLLGYLFYRNTKNKKTYILTMQSLTDTVMSAISINDIKKITEIALAIRKKQPRLSAMLPFVVSYSCQNAYNNFIEAKNERVAELEGANLILNNDQQEHESKIFIQTIFEHVCDWAWNNQASLRDYFPAPDPDHERDSEEEDFKEYLKTVRERRRRGKKFIGDNIETIVERLRATDNLNTSITESQTHKTFIFNSLINAVQQSIPSEGSSREGWFNQIRQSTCVFGGV